MNYNDADKLFFYQIALFFSSVHIIAVLTVYGYIFYQAGAVISNFVQKKMKKWNNSC